MLEYSEILESLALLYYEVLRGHVDKYLLMDELVLVNDIRNRIMHIK